MNIEANIDPATEIRASSNAANLRSGMEDLAAFAKEAADVERALEQLEDVCGDDSRKSIVRLKKQLAEFEPSVTVLGQVKAGKTLLINAMAGWPDLLPSDVNPWTSVVTSLHLSPAEERAESGAKFQFMTEDEWRRLTTKGGRIGELAGRAGAESELKKIQDQISALRDKSRARLGRKFELLMGQEHEYGYFDKNLLERYICLGDDFDTETQDAVADDQGRFADITRSADLFLNCQSVPFRMCIRDTPGVNDTFLVREMVTIKAVRDSRVCVVVLSATQALTSVDMALIRMISNLKSREVIIFVNRIDELSDPANQLREIEDSIRETLKQHDGPQDAQIVFGSAYWANKVLNGDLNRMHERSTQALLAMAESLPGNSIKDRSPAEIVWEMSGLPRLMRIMSTQIVTSLGAPFLAKIASSAVAVATSQEAARRVRIEGDSYATDRTAHEIRTEFHRLAQENIEELEKSISEVFEDYHQRADRAHGNFVERATHSLLDHLERFGEQEVWEYDPTGLRVLLRSAYSTMGNRMRKVARQRYEKAVSDSAHLLYRCFGPSVEGIQIAVPDVPQIPSPVALAQTIALDFNDSWWAGWWRRTRGYKAFAKQFRKLICDETEDFMVQMKHVQTADIRTELTDELQSFLEMQKDILLDLVSGAARCGDVENLFHDAEETRRREMLDETLTKLRLYAT